MPSHVLIVFALPCVHMRVCDARQWEANLATQRVELTAEKTAAVAAAIEQARRDAAQAGEQVTTRHAHTVLYHPPIPRCNNSRAQAGGQVESGR